jgi:hypothetical protein
MAQHAPARAEPPAVVSTRRGLRLRPTNDGARLFFEVEDPGELERLKDQLSRSEYQAGVALRGLWRRGVMNPEPTASAMDRLGMPRGGFAEHEADDERDEAQDELRAAVRSMRYMGMGGRLAIEVVVYERRIRTADELDALREALGRLADHLRRR